MLVVLIITGFGLFLSIGIHICVLLGIWCPPIELGKILYGGILILSFAGTYKSRRLRKAYSREDFKKAVKDVCPKKLITALSILIFYFIVLFGFALKGLFAIGSIAKSPELADMCHKIYFLPPMLLYAAGFAGIYVHGNLVKKHENESLCELEREINEFSGED